MLTTHRHTSDHTTYAETILNTPVEEITGTAAYRNQAHKYARRVITEAIQDFKANLTEVTDPALVKYIRSQITRLENVLKG